MQVSTTLATITNTTDTQLYIPPLSIELFVTIVCVLSVFLNSLCWLTVKLLRRHSRTPFLLSVGLLVITEIILTSVRAVHAFLGVIAIATDTIQFDPSWYDYPDIILWGLSGVFQFVRNWWLVCITSMRMLMVVFPLQSHIPINDVLVRRLFIFTCIFSIVLPASAIPQVVSGNVFDFTSGNSGVIITLFALSNGAPAVLVLLLTSAIVRQLLCRGHSALLQKDDEDQKTNRRATRTVVAIATCFLLFQLPLFVISAAYFSSPRSSAWRHAFYLALNLIYLDTLSNCGVLLACNNRFRAIFCAKMRCLPAEQIHSRLHKSAPAASDGATGSSLLDKGNSVEMNQI